jgi:hypothetical protein
MRKITDTNGSWTVSLTPRFAFLWYAPERRFSVSIGLANYSYNVRLWGPRKLSWER